MAYEKQTWQSGDIITAEKLNHIEDGIKDNGPGYEVDIDSDVIIDSSITTNTAYNYATSETVSIPHYVDANEITVEFEGTKYELTKQTSQYGGGTFYGAEINPQTWSMSDDYPLSLNFYKPSDETSLLQLSTHSPGTYSLKVVVNTITTDPSKEFENAVQTTTQPLIDAAVDPDNILTIVIAPSTDSADKMTLVSPAKSELVATLPYGEYVLVRIKNNTVSSDFPRTAFGQISYGPWGQYGNNNINVSVFPILKNYGDISAINIYFLYGLQVGSGSGNDFTLFTKSIALTDA